MKTLKYSITFFIAVLTISLTAALPQSGSAQDFSTASGINNHGEIVGGSLLDNQSGFDAFLLGRKSFWDFGTFGGFASLAYAINERGDAIGQSDTPEFDAFGDAISVGFLADDAGIHRLGTLPGLKNSQPFSINNRGAVVGRAYNNAEHRRIPFDFRAFVWERGVMRDIGTLGGSIAEAFGINDAGTIVGDAATRNGEEHAFVFAKGAMHDLGTLGGNFSQARSVNNREQIVGRARLSNGDEHAFLYERGRMQDLGTLGGNFSRAEFLNNRGEIVGFSLTADGDFHAFVYSEGRMRDLGTLGGFYSAALGINDRGEIVGESDTAAGDTHAFVIRDGVMIDLDSRLPR